jgi:hypothetical protein
MEKYFPAQSFRYDVGLIFIAGWDHHFLDQFGHVTRFLVHLFTESAEEAKVYVSKLCEVSAF